MFKIILVPIDVSYETSRWQEPALNMASQLAKFSETRIHALTVVPTNLLAGYYPDLQARDVGSEAHAKLEHVVRGIIPADIPVTIGVEKGGICAEILRVARALPADLIVMSSHGPMVKDYLLGSNASHVTLHAECSVLVARNKPSVDKPKNHGRRNLAWQSCHDVAVRVTHARDPDPPFREGCNISIYRFNPAALRASSMI